MGEMSENTKVFVIGRNKTGTTSMAAALGALGYRIGEQSEAELLTEDWARRDFRRIIDHCHTADAFQDVPFSWDFTYQAVDCAFPGSRFVLTVRASADEWFDSVLRFQTRLVGKGRTPTAEDLQAFPYREEGWLWRQHQLQFGVDASTLFDRAIYTAQYEGHNRRVREYFRHRPDDLLELDLAEPGAMQKLGEFLGRDTSGIEMPHLNRSGERD